MEKEIDNAVVHISMLSGGQDSTAMTLRILEEGLPLDHIVFCDTGMEHDDMYEYIDKLDAFFQRKYNMKIVRVHPKYTFDEYIRQPRTKGEKEGMTRGTPSVIDMCFWRREAKEYSFNRWVKAQGIEEYKTYVGYVFGETKRYGNSPEYTIAPLIEWKWREEEVQQYLKLNEMENKLYQHFTRTGCAVCPKQSEASKYMVYKHYPDKWDYMKRVEKELNEDPNRTGFYPRWHDIMTIPQLEEKFKKKDRQGTFDLDFEPLSDCFCKI